MRPCSVRRLGTLPPLAGGASLTHDLTLLRGADGALFGSAGLHRVEVDVTWDMDDVPVRVSGTTSVMVTPAVDESHAAAAQAVLSSPDLLLTVALGGDHLDEGLAALRTALADKTLAPHYAVIEAKRFGRPFGKRKANPSASLNLLKGAAVMSPSEVQSVAAVACAPVGVRETVDMSQPVSISALVGRWERASVEGCARRYPMRLRYHLHGVYEAPDGAETGAIWHGGDYAVDDDTRLSMQTANDAMLRYVVVGFDGMRLTLEDDAGCRFEYVRQRE